MTRAQAALELVKHLDAVRVLESVGIHPSNEDNLYSHQLIRALDQHGHTTAADVVSCAECVAASRKDIP